MPDILILDCPKCGGKLQFGSNIKDLFCIHCGTRLLYQNGGLIAAMEESYKAQANQFEENARYTSKQSSIVAIERIEKEIETTRADLAPTEMGPIQVLGLLLLLFSSFGIIDRAISASVSGYGVPPGGEPPLLGVSLPIWIILVILSICIMVLGKPRKSERRKQLESHLATLEAELAKHKQNIIS